MTWSDLSERLENKIIPEPNSGCWLWIGAQQGRYGHGAVRRGKKSAPAYRAVYEELKGPIPDGLGLDHFWCDNPPCVNPDHVRPASSQENTLRSSKTIAGAFLARDHCAQGHLFDEENTLYEKRSRARVCRTCKNEAIRDWVSRNGSKAVAYSTAWRERNRDKVNTYRRAYDKRKRAEAKNARGS